jgi:hypothetical protein
MVYYNQPEEAMDPITGASNQIPGFSDIITQYIGNKNNGTVVDVGAHDGWKWSNSWRQA